MIEKFLIDWSLLNIVIDMNQIGKKLTDIENEIKELKVMVIQQNNAKKMLL